MLFSREISFPFWADCAATSPARVSRLATQGQCNPPIANPPWDLVSQWYFADLTSRQFTGWAGLVRRAGPANFLHHDLSDPLSLGRLLPVAVAISSRTVPPQSAAAQKCGGTLIPAPVANQSQCGANSYPSLPTSRLSYVKERQSVKPSVVGQWSRIGILLSRSYRSRLILTARGSFRSAPWSLGHCFA